MWEQIRANQRRSAVLLIAMGTMLAIMGYALGEIMAPGFGFMGMGVAFIIFLVQMMVYWTAAESVLLSGLGAREVTRDEMPRLHNIVEEMVIASGLGYTPKVYLIESDVPNALAVGRKPETSAVAVTTGLLYRLDRDQLQGVVAHEVAHLKNRDTRFMTLAGVMLGSIIIVSELIWQAMRHGGGRMHGRSRSRGNDNGGAAVLIILLIALVVAILGPFLAQVLYFATSRKREYLADASGAAFTRYPEGLAGALERISGAGLSRLETSRAIAPMFIINPMHAADGEATGLFSTHPPTRERTSILRAMGASASFLAYEQAFRSLHNGRGVIGAQTLGQAADVHTRAPSSEGPIETRAAARETVYALAGYVNTKCDCGMEIRIPQHYDEDFVRCPRCGRKVPVPVAMPAQPAAGQSPLGPAAAALAVPLLFTRMGTGWESFRCSCGATITMSPAFAGKSVTCSKCARKVAVENAA